jgi:hypothetical protein
MGTEQPVFIQRMLVNLIKRVLFIANEVTTVPRRGTVTKVFHRAVCAGMFFASESAAKKHTGADGLDNTPNFAYSQSLANTPNITHPQKLHTPKTKRICQRTNYSSA